MLVCLSHLEMVGVPEQGSIWDYKKGISLPKREYLSLNQVHTMGVNFLFCELEPDRGKEEHWDG